MEEIERAIQKLVNDKAPNPDGITAEMLKMAEEKGIRKLYRKCAIRFVQEVNHPWLYWGPFRSTSRQMHLHDDRISCLLAQLQEIPRTETLFIRIKLFENNWNLKYSRDAVFRRHFVENHRCQNSDSVWKLWQGFQPHFCLVARVPGLVQPAGVLLQVPRLEEYVK